MKSHYLALDVLKVCLAFMVVALHRELYLDCGEIFGNVIDAFVHLAVPTFFIINGYYFACVKDSVSFKRYLKRWGVLYLTWTIIYGYFIVLYSPSWQVAITDFILGYFHLWYVINSIYAFVIIWILIKYGNERLLCVVAVIAAIMGIIFAFSGFGDRLYRNFMFFALPFIAIGYLISKRNIKLKGKHGLIFLCVGMVMLITEYYVAKQYMGVKRMELGVSLYFVCPVIFIVCNNCTLTYRGKYLADFSTGIFLTHQLAVPIIDRIPLLHNIFDTNSICRTFANILIASVLTVGLIYIQKILKFKLL